MGHNVSRIEHHPLDLEIHIYHGKGQLDRPGRAIDTTLRVLCAQCNNVTLGRLQEAVKPALESLAFGLWLTPSRQNLDVLAAWASMFAMTFEAADVATAAISPTVRKDFLGTLAPPPGFHVFLGRQTEARDGFINHRALSVSVRGGRHTPGQVTTFTIGHVYFQVISGLPDGVFDPIDYALKIGALAVWPADSRIAFLSAERRTPEQVEMLAASAFLRRMGV